jgi:hypothetical protein
MIQTKMYEVRDLGGRRKEEGKDDDWVRKEEDNIERRKCWTRAR